MASFHHRELLNDVVSLREDLSRQLKDLRAAQTGMAEAFQVPKSPPGTRVTLGAVRADWFGTLILVECGSP